MHAECLALSKDSANTNFTTTIIFIFIPLTPGARRMPERAPSSWMPAAWLIFKQGTFLGTSCLEIHPQKSFPIVRPKQLRGGEITFVVMTDVGRGSGGPPGRERMLQDMKRQVHCPCISVLVPWEAAAGGQKEGTRGSSSLCLGVKSSLWENCGPRVKDWVRHLVSIVGQIAEPPFVHL